MSFQEFHQVDWKDTLRFFYRGLKDVILTRRVADTEILYAASILASYARTSPGDMHHMPPFSSLSEVFDHFVLEELQNGKLRDPKLLEAAGAQSLFLIGFFASQMSRRHNLVWYEAMGRDFYKRAAEHSKRKAEQDLFGRFSTNFYIWTRSYQSLRRKIYEERLIIPPIH